MTTSPHPAVWPLDPAFPDLYAGLLPSVSRSLKSVCNRDRFLAACACSPVDVPPVWLMRQAGRALPEYRALKETYSFTDLVRTPDLATEVTLQPIRRFDFDAAILFSDILVVPEAMGQPYHFRENGGIEMEFALSTAEDIRRLDSRNVTEKLQYVAEALRLIKPALNGRTALLGFAGSPWTLANYMLEGCSAHTFTRAKSLLYTDPQLFSELLEKLTRAVTDFLQLQIDSGVDAVQIFDSAGGSLADNAFEPASGRWIRQIIASLHNQVPVLLFSKGTHGRWPSLVNTGANILSIDWTQPLAEIRATLPKQVGVQGNLDPALLCTTPEIVATETKRIVQSMQGQSGYIFNLGHGVSPNAKLECIQALVTTVRATA